MKVDPTPNPSDFARNIEGAIRGPRDAPLQLQAFADAAALPPAAAWIFGTVYVSDINTIAFSDGTDWFPLTKGAAL